MFLFLSCGFYIVTFPDSDLINRCLVGFKTNNDSAQVNKHKYLFVQSTFLCVYCTISTNFIFLKPLDFTKSKIKETFHRIYFIMLIFLPTHVLVVKFVYVYLPLRNPSQLPKPETGMMRQLICLLL